MAAGQERMRGVVICGGQRVESTTELVGRGFRKLGYRVAHLPTRDYTRPAPPSVYSAIENIEDRLVEAVRSVDAELVIWIMCKVDYKPGLIPSLRDRLPDVRWAFHSFDDPFTVTNGEFKRSLEFDFAITCCVGSLDDYARIGVPAVCLYPPFDEEQQTAIPANEAARCDFSFIATNLYPPAKFPRSFFCRADIVRAVDPLGQLAIYGPWDTRYGWGGDYGVPELKEKWRGKLRFHQLAPVYKASRINLNSHVRPDGYLYLNERFTNVLGSGAFMLVDPVNGIDELQPKEGKAFDTYASLDELKEKVAFYLANDTARLAVAARGLELARRRFTNTAFAEEAMRFADGL